MTSKSNEAAHLYRLYWRLCLSDICHKTGIDATAANKRAVHEFNKHIMGVHSIANQSEEFMSNFIFQICVWYAVEKGIFIRNNKRQPFEIEHMPFSQIVDVDGEKKRVWDLL